MAGDGSLMIMDSEGAVVEWSRQAEDMFGYTAAEAVGQAAAHLVAPALGSASGGEVTLPTAGGRSVSTHLRARPLVRPGGSVAWAVFHARESGVSRPGVGVAVLDALFGHAPVALHVLDEDLRIVSASIASATLLGDPPGRVVGKRLTDAYGLSASGEVDAMLRRMMETRVSAPEHVVQVHPESGRRRPYMAGVTGFALQGSQEAVLGVAAVVDVTERETTAARMRVLDAVRQSVGSTLDMIVTCQELVKAVVPGFAEVAVVELVDAVVCGEEPPLAPLSRGVSLRRAAFRHADGEHQVEAYPVGDVRSLPFRTPYARALMDLKPRVIDLDSDPPWLTADPERAGAIRASGARTLLTAPMALHGRVLGLLSLYRGKEADSFSEREMAVAMELAAHTALCIDNARRYTREHTIAVTVQRQLLPAGPSSQTAIETAHLHLPGDEGGGGWFDTFALSGARTALAVGDVSGHGIHTAATMGQLRTVIRSLSALDLEADELLARLNDTAMRLAQERAATPPGDTLHQQALTATCAYAVYDPLARTCTFALAGHPKPVIAHPDGSTEIPEVSVGPALGSSEGPPYETATVTLADGCVLAFCTASLLPMSPGGARGDPAPLRQVLADTDRPLQDLCDDVLYRLSGSTGPGDRILLLGRTHTFPSDHVASWQLDHDPAAAATARSRTRRQLTHWGVEEDTICATELIVSELVANAIRHGSAPMRLSVIRHRTLTCEVHDGSSSTPRLRHARTVDEGGRGLFIVAQLAQKWGSRYTPDGKIVWTEQALVVQQGQIQGRPR
jgi:PAS domain S-box-containing protein